MSQKITVSELRALERHGLVPAWLWDAWNRAVCGRYPDSPLEEELEKHWKYKIGFLTPFSLMILMFVPKTWTMTAGAASLIAVILGLVMLYFLTRFVSLDNRLWKFALHQYNLRMALDLPFSSGSFGSDEAREKAETAEVKLAVLVEVAQVQNPASTSTREKFGEQKRTFLRFQLVEKNWDPPHAKARRRLACDPEGTIEWATGTKVGVSEMVARYVEARIMAMGTR